MGVDASHRNTGVVVADFFPDGKIKDIVHSETIKTKKVDGVLNEVENVKNIIGRVNELKDSYAVISSCCEIAHFGQSFASSRNVGITWAIALGTKSEPYTEKQVRAMFKGQDKKPAKEMAFDFAVNNHPFLISKITDMDDHQVDALCTVFYHFKKINRI